MATSFKHFFQTWFQRELESTCDADRVTQHAPWTARRAQNRHNCCISSHNSTNLSSKHSLSASLTCQINKRKQKGGRQCHHRVDKEVMASSVGRGTSHVREQNLSQVLSSSQFLGGGIRRTSSPNLAKNCETSCQN